MSEKRGRLGGGLVALAAGLAPSMAAIAAFVAGASMLASAALPGISTRLKILDDAAPIFVLEFSHFAASLIGLFLMLLGSGLWRRREGAFWLALGLLIAGILFSFTKGLEYEEALVLLGAMALLWFARKSFDRPSRLFPRTIGSVWLVATVAAVISIGALGFWAYHNVIYTDELWWRFVRDGDASRFLRAGVAVAMLTLVFAVMTLVSGPGRHDDRSSPTELERAAEIIACSKARAQAQIILLGDKALMFSDSGKAFIAYRRRGSRWIALGDPIGPAEEFKALMWRFVEEADKAGASAVFYTVSTALLPALASMGFILRQVGEAAIIDTATFTISGKGKQNLRTACNRAAADGCLFEVLPPGSASQMADELKAVSDAWMTERASAEKSFSMGRFDLAYLDRTPLAVMRKDGQLLAFANIMRAGSEASIDLMRYGPGAPHGVMDMLFVNLIHWARDNGIPNFNLGMAPLAGLETHRMAPVFAQIGALVFAEGAGLYNFGGLHAYKGKFGPRWEPMFMAARPGVMMALALLDVALLTSGGWSGLLFKRRLRKDS